jgi:predicted  nucleic acid-binding Zn-ribbon protein
LKGLKKYQGIKCGHRGIPRSDRIPLACPACNSRTWRKKPKTKKAKKEI